MKCSTLGCETVRVSADLLLSPDAQLTFFSSTRVVWIMNLCPESGLARAAKLGQGQGVVVGYRVRSDRRLPDMGSSYVIIA